MALTIKDMMVEYEGESLELERAVGGRTVNFYSYGDTAVIELSMYLDEYADGSDLFDSDGWVSDEGKGRIKKYLDDTVGIAGMIGYDPEPGVANIVYSVPLTDFMDAEYDSFFAPLTSHGQVIVVDFLGADQGPFFAPPFGRGYEIVADLLRATDSVSFLDRV